MSLPNRNTVRRIVAWAPSLVIGSIALFLGIQSGQVLQGLIFGGSLLVSALCSFWLAMESMDRDLLDELNDES